MRKKIQIVLLSIAIGLLIMACSKSKTEYNIDEFGELYNPVYEKFEEKDKYLTKEDYGSGKAYETFKECAKKSELPIGREIELTGLKDSAYNGFFLKSSDGKYSVLCKYNDGKAIFINNGEAITIRGVFCANKENFLSFSDVKILSPKKIKVDYNENIDESIENFKKDELIDLRIVGTVSGIMAPDKFNTAFSTVANSELFDGLPSYIDNVAVISGDTYTAYIAYPSYMCESLKEGNKIAVDGGAYALTTLLHADGAYEVQSILYESPDNIYIYQ